MDYTKLKTRLADADMLALSTDEERLAVLNDKTIIRYIPLQTTDIKTYLRMNSLWIPLKNATSTSAVTVYDALTDPETTSFNMADSSVMSFVETIMTLLINDIPEFTSTHKDAILAMSEEMVSWAENNGYNPLRIGYFSKARAL